MFWAVFEVTYPGKPDKNDHNLKLCEFSQQLLNMTSKKIQVSHPGSLHGSRPHFGHLAIGAESCRNISPSFNPNEDEVSMHWVVED
jgi:hypothetical protein